MNREPPRADRVGAERTGRPPLLGVLAVVAVVTLAGAALALRFLTGGTSAPTAAGAAPRFADEAASSSLAFTYDGPFTYALGGGVAVLDCNDDGLPEVYLAGGEGLAALFRNDSEIGGPLRFTRLAATETDLTAVIGAYPIDIDSDGVADLVTLRYGENVVLRGLGGCRFERANEAWGLDGGAAITEAFSATWEGDARWPTVAFGNFADPESDDFETWCQPNVLVRPAGEAPNAGFGAPLELTPSFCTQSLLFSDWDGSGRKDLRVSNDRAYYPAAVGEEQLWRIAPGEAPRLYGVDDGWVRVQVEGMGIAAHDLTGDGLPEFYLTSQNASKLHALAAPGGGTVQPSYRDVGLRYGVNVAQPFTGPHTSLPSTAWHPEFDDVNNDGFIDLFVSKGNVTSQPDFALMDPSNLLLGGPGGTFRESADAAGILNFERGRGAAVTDLNLDGKLDIILVNYQAPVRVWRNTSEGLGGWLAVKLTQPAPNVDAIGAVVEVRLGDVVDRRELVVGGGHAGGELGWIAFGLGPNEAAEVRVTWPGSRPGEWQRVAANQHVVIDRSVGESRPWPGEGG